MTFVDAAKVGRVAVLGAGTMGHGIAQIAAMAGAHVFLQDINEEAVSRGLARIADNLDKGVQRGKVTAQQRESTLGRITTSVAVAEAVADADVVVEAAPEIAKLKQELFSAIDAAAPAHAVLATNTSSLSVAGIASAVRAPQRVVGMHFFNPVHIMKLVEVVRHAAADEGAVQCAVGLARLWGKTPITVNDAPGFASSRLGLILGLEAMRMLEQGVASAADIDTAMKLGYGHPMGPLELTDLVGLDVRLSIAEYLSGEIGEHFTPPALLRDMVASGRLGKKSGRGFYRWQGNQKLDDSPS